MTYNYEVEVKYHDDNADQATRSRYYRILEMHDGVGIGHKKTLTSTMNISSETELTKNELENLLGDDIPILSFNQLE